MEKQIHFQDVGVSFKKSVVFEHFSFSLHEGKDVCLIGGEGVGKTTLLRSILGECSFYGEILKEATVRGLIHVNVKGEVTISDYLKYDFLSKDEQNLIQQFLNLKSLAYPIGKLNSVFKVKVLLLEQVLKHPKFLVLDDLLSDFSQKEKMSLFQFLHHLGITTFYVTSNMEDVLLFPYLVVMGESGVLMEGATVSVLKEERLLKRLGFSLPFFVDLSLQLQSYDLIYNVYTEEKELTEQIWKSN